MPKYNPCPVERPRIMHICLHRLVDESTNTIIDSLMKALTLSLRLTSILVDVQVVGPAASGLLGLARAL